MLQTLSEMDLIIRLHNKDEDPDYDIIMHSKVLAFIMIKFGGEFL
jgi:hypothetical protein